MSWWDLYIWSALICITLWVGYEGPGHHPLDYVGFAVVAMIPGLNVIALVLLLMMIAYEVYESGWRSLLAPWRK